MAVTLLTTGRMVALRMAMTFALVILFFIMLALWVDAYDDAHYNSTHKKGLCTVTNITEYRVSCHDQPCYNATCPKDMDCWNLVIDLALVYMKKVYRAELVMFEKSETNNRDKVTLYEKIDCYFPPDDPTDISLHQKNDGAYIATALAVTFLFIGCIILWCFMEWAYRRGNGRPVEVLGGDSYSTAME